MLGLNQFAKHSRLCLLLFAIVGSVFFAGCSDDGGQGQQAPPPPQVGVVALKTTDVPMSVELPGRAAAYNVSEVRPQVTGIILERMFKEGTDVEKGQQLYQIDPAMYEASYETALASQKRAEANLENTRRLANRYSELVKTKAVSSQDYDTAMANYRQAQADLASAQAAVKTAKINLDYTMVFSPVSGRIGISSVTEGALVTATQPTPLAYVQQMDRMYIDITQSSAQYLRLQRSIQSGQVTPGQLGEIPVDITLEDGVKYAHRGRLKLYDITVHPGTGTIVMRAEVDNPERLILPGMFVRATISEGMIKDAILVPQQAVQRNQKGLPYVLVVGSDNKVELRVFNTAYGSHQGSWITVPGLTDESGTAVTQEEAAELRKKGQAVHGLLPGEKIIMEGSLRLRGGTMATPVDYIPPSERPSRWVKQDPASPEGSAVVPK